LKGLGVFLAEEDLANVVAAITAKGWYSRSGACVKAGAKIPTMPNGNFPTPDKE
jgi:hypothetical protein